ncbi:MAG: glycosyltransferase family 4 protein [Candidatus Paceibacterota bacterium]|jgi:glycosyltransferase involved in cell wall biosynthesis
MKNRLLIITQKVDRRDQILGFFHRWLEEFAKQYKSVVAICLQAGEYSLPDNVRVLSLGKESGISRLKYLWRFYWLLWRERNNYDLVFVHMNPIYVVLAGWWWRLWQKPIALWYTHRQVDWKLRLAEKIVNRIFSASAESFRLPSRKLIITGHGIDTDLYRPLEIKRDKFVILSVGRLARTKNHHLAIEAMALANGLDKPWELWLVGEAIYPEDSLYKQELIKLIETKKLNGHVKLLGAVAPVEMPNLYQSADLLVNLSDTGSLDKVVLEAMSSGVRVVSSNIAFIKILPSDYFCSKEPTSIALAIVHALARPVDPRLREIVVAEHNLSRLIVDLTARLDELKK